MNNHPLIIKQILLNSLLLLCSFIVLSQESDTLLTFKQLGREDLVSNEDQKDQNTLSGSRTLKELDDLPFTIYIITKEQIQEFGYVTLTDALKSVPGIRVSQPGSGPDGETFIMRGLLGNQYTKILINDIPIRPTAARSMPIGAQLPIQQADRIEIIFGPTPGIYGADAMAGVVNIITKETERPFYVQSDVSLGTQGFQHLSVSLGGKLGIDQNIVKFNIFGSYTDIEDRPVNYDQSNLYNPQTYAPNQNQFSQIPNYVGNTNSSIIRAFPHSSESIGARINYRGFRLNFEQINRQDHSSLGLNPVGVSLANPLNFTGESITSLNANWSKDMERLKLRIDVSNIRYELNPRSSNNYVLNTLNQGVSEWENRNLGTAFDTVNFRNLASDIYENYLSRQRYSYANSSDWYIDPLITYSVNEKLVLTIGANILIGDNQPYINYLTIPFVDKSEQGDLERELSLQNNPIIPPKEEFNNIGLYGQAYFKFGKLGILGIIRHDQHNQFGNNLSSSISTIYKLGEDLSFRASYSNAAQTPSSYYAASSYDVVTTPDSAWFRLSNPELEREQSSSYEFGLRWGRSDNFDTDIAYFRTKSTNLLSYGTDATIGNPLIYTATYRNDFPSFMVIRGFQGRLRMDLFDNTRGSLNFQFAKGEELLAFDGGKINRVRGVGKWSWQGRFSTQIRKKWFLQSVHTFSQQWVSRSLINVKDFEENGRYIIPKYYTLDLTVRYQLSQAFQGFIQAFNVFNKEYGGIAAQSFDSDLVYNPQPLRTFRVGLNYRMR